MPGKRYAAIDIGTVTCRLLVAEVADGHLRELDRECAITDLGQDVDATGVLRKDAMERVDAQIASYRSIIDGYGQPGQPVEVLAMATSASRDARNADEFEALLARRGVDLQVIPGSTEAALSFAGATVDHQGQQVLVVDIGGGSTELIAGVGGGHPVRLHSFNIGCRRITERFIASDPPAAEELDAARAWFQPQFAAFFDGLLEDGFDIDRLIAVAGTATSVVSVDQAMDPYDSSRVHGACVSADTLDAVCARLAALPLAERKQVVGLQPGRAPVIVAGMAILRCIMDLARVDAFTVSESDILQGMIMHAAGGQPCMANG